MANQSKLQLNKIILISLCLSLGCYAYAKPTTDKEKDNGQATNVSSSKDSSQKDSSSSSSAINASIVPVNKEVPKTEQELQQKQYQENEQKRKEALADIKESEINIPKGIYPYEVKIEVPGNSTAQKLLNEHLSLVTKKDVPGVDDEQVEYLLRSVHDETQQILGTLGYFNVKTSIDLEGSTYIIHVDCGQPAKVNNVAVVVTGAIEDDKNFPKYYRDIFHTWLLPVGDTFNQSDWGSSKASALSSITSLKYPLAKIVKSRAEIDPEKDTADLKVEIDSGKPVKIGQITISGNKRYPISIIENLKNFNTGDYYDSLKLLDYKQALETDGHYGAALVAADFDHMQGDEVPVIVKVEEVPKHKIDVGLEYDTSTNLGLRLGYDNYNVFGRGYIGNAVLNVNRYEQYFGLGLTQPRDKKGYFKTTGINYSNKTIQNLRSRTIGANFLYVRNDKDIESKFGVEYYLENSKIINGPSLGRNYVTMLTAQWTRNKIQTSDRPYNGYYVNVKVGTTLGKFLSTANAQRIVVNGSYYYTPYNRKLGTIALRGSIGYVHSKNTGFTSLPQAILFRTGGSSSVRGYEHEGIGINAYKDTVLGGKALFTASIEYQYPIRRDLSIAIFHDVGAVADSFKKMKLQHGTGMGIRWYIPFAPISFDVAYGHQRKKWAWYIGLGTHFK